MRDQQIDAQSHEIITLANKVEVMSQIVSIAFLESKGISPETKLELANLAKSVATKSKSAAVSLVDSILKNAKEEVQVQKEQALNQVQEKAQELLSTIKSEISNVDELI